MLDLCIVCHNNAIHIERLLTRLQLTRQDFLRPDFRLYIADNGSTDQTWDVLQGLDAQYLIEQIDYNTNVGYASACNRLASYGQGDVIGLLNADTWFTAQDLIAIENRFDEHPDMMVLGPKQRDERGYVTAGGIFGTNESPKHRGWHEYDPDDTAYCDRLPSVTVSGAAYFIRRSAWEAMTECPVYRGLYPDAKGAFLPTKHYYDETWASYHIRHHYGEVVYYDGEISIGHTWHASSAIGGEADQLFRVSQELFREACDAHGITHD